MVHSDKSIRDQLAAQHPGPTGARRRPFLQKRTSMGSTSSNTESRSCFIAAPIAVDTSPLREELEARAIHWTDAASAGPGTSWEETAKLALARADFVCVIVAQKARSVNVFYEWGYAVGYGRPVIAFVEPGTELGAYATKASAIARIALEDRDALRLHLDAFLQHGWFKPPRHPRPSPKLKTVDTSWVTDAMEPSRISREAQLKAVVARLFQQSGAVLARAPAGAQVGADMALWIDELGASLGNPIIVEVKGGRLSETVLTEAELWLRNHVRSTSAAAGLLIYWDKKGTDMPRPSSGWPLVVRVSLRELAELVGRGQLVARILSERNKAAHGAG